MNIVGLKKKKIPYREGQRNEKAALGDGFSTYLVKHTVTVATSQVEAAQIQIM